jgi:hypothetical protein
MRRRMEARLRGQSAEELPSQAEHADHDRRQPSPPRSISPRAPSPSFPPPAAEPKVEGSIAPGMAKQGTLSLPRHFEIQWFPSICVFPFLLALIFRR